MTTRRATMAICAAVLCACAPMWMESDGLVSRANAQSECVREWLAGQPVPGCDDSVAQIAVFDPDGPGEAPSVVYASGDFTVAGGQFARRLAKWTDGGWSAVDPRLNSSSFSSSVSRSAMVTLPNGDLVIGGSFSFSLDGQRLDRIARWNGSRWSSMGAPLDGDVFALATGPRGELYAGGSFAKSGGLRVAGVARWDGSGWLAMGPTSTKVGVVGTVNSLKVLSSGDVVVAGQFDKAGDVLTKNIAIWDSSSGAWREMAGGLDGFGVSAIAVGPDDDVYVIGDSGTPFNPGKTQIMHWSERERTWKPMHQFVSDYGVYLMSVAVRPNGNVIVGAASSFRDSNRWLYGIAEWNGETWEELTDGGVDMGVYSTAFLGNGDLICGGYFTRAGRQDVSCIARHDGHSWNRMGEFEWLWIGDIVETASGAEYWWGKRPETPYAGLWLRSSSGFHRVDRDIWPPFLPTRSNTIVARGCVDDALDCSTQLIEYNGSSLRSLTQSFDGTCNAILEFPDDSILVGGAQLMIDGRSFGCLARYSNGGWSAPTENLAAGGQLNGSLRGMTLLADGSLVVFGYFDIEGSRSVPSILRWNGSAFERIDTGIGDGYRWFSGVLGLSDGRLVAWGYFTYSDEDHAEGASVWNPTTRAWTPMGLDGVWILKPEVDDVALCPNGDVAIVGSFEAVRGIPLSNAFLWTPSTNAITPMGQNVLHRAFDVFPLADGDIVVTGAGSNADGKVSWNYATFGCRCVADADADGMITLEDFDAFVAAFESGDASADLNADGFITMEDFDAFVGVFETGC